MVRQTAFVKELTMDKTTRDIQAHINAHNILLQTLFSEVYKDDRTGLRTLEQTLTAKLGPPQHPNPVAQQEATEIQHQTQHVLWTFFRGVESRFLTETKE